MVATSIAFFLFGIEWFHFLGHCSILFRIRLLPRKDMARLRYYSFSELLTMLPLAILASDTLRLIAVFHVLAHLYYVVSWEQTESAIKFVSWSALDRLQSASRSKWDWQSIVATWYDCGVHLCMTYYLSHDLTTFQAIAALTIVLVLVLVILFGPYYAWASPSKIPPWIQKRIHPENSKNNL